MQGEHALPGDPPVPVEGEDPGGGPRPVSGPASRPFFLARFGNWTRATAAATGAIFQSLTQDLEQAGQARHGQGLDHVRGNAELPVPGLARPDGDGQARRGSCSSRSSVTCFGGRSVSGYIRSGPGRMRSKPLVPSLSAWRVSEGMPIVASRARMAISWAPVLTSSAGPQTTTTVSSVVARTALRTACHSRAREGLARAVGVDDVGQRRQAGDDPDAVGDLAGEARVRLGLPVEELAEAAQDDAEATAPGVEGLADGMVARLPEEAGDVLGSRTGTSPA